MAPLWQFNLKQTKRKKAMKTTNNVQKATLKISAVIVGIILISFTVRAQDLWQGLISNDNIKTIALAMTENPKEHETTSSNKNSDSESYFELFEESTEESMELESWMTSETFFSSAINLLEEEIEDHMELESWMTNDAVFKLQRTDTKSIIETEAEPKLELEEWMTSDNIWKLLN